MRNCLTVLLLLFLSAPAWARDSTDHWVEIQSEHFTVLTDSNERQARRIASQFERMRSVFHTLFPNWTYDKGAPIAVLALKDRKGFQSLEPAAYLGKGQLDLAGLFIRSQDRNYVLLRLDSEGEHPFSVVYHEYTHYLMARTAEWMPLWMSEGLAEFYQNTDIQEKDVLLGQPSEYDIELLRQTRLLPLATLLKVDHTSPYYHEEQKGSVFYSESWALMHYLQIADNTKGTHHLQDYAQYLVHQEDPVTAAQHAFGDLDALQKALDNYVSQSSFQMFRMKTAVAVNASAFKVRAVPTAEANAVRAGVLVYNQRNQEAQALLESVMREDPKSALAHETMGYLKFREADTASAKQWFGEAVQLDTQSYLGHYYFAVMSLQQGGHQNDAEIEASLRAAINLNPDFALACDSLATFLGSRNEKLEEAHMFNLKAVELEPDNLSFRLNTAFVLAQREQYSSAVAVLKIATRIAKNPEELAIVRSRIDQFEKAQATVETAAAVSVDDGTQRIVLTRKSGNRSTQNVLSAPAPEEPKYPEEATGPHRKVQGVIRGVQCSYPTVLTLTIEQAGKPVALYSNNYFKIVFTLGNYNSDDEIVPCKAIEGMKANVVFAGVKDDRVAGQIVAIELDK